ncbi:MAG: response regulator [Burkholderiaceae bacterium]|nr:MAG: response regulator [Burkholderiaceae bacterium]
MTVPIPTRTAPTVLLVDDEPANLQVLRQILQPHYRLLFAKDGAKALELARTGHPDLILLDVMMPGLTGLEVCEQLKQDPSTAQVPVIFVTALHDEEDEMRGLAAGAVDYITKPVSAPIVKARVKTHLSLVSMHALQESRRQVIERLGRAAEYKDNETGLHVIRMSRYAGILARALGWHDDDANELEAAAPMHDIGKIGIPDHILLKPGRLDEAEWAIMRRHPQIGAEIIGEDRSPLLRMARQIALCHHEKFDGSGYPSGLAGDDIPLEARIVAVADVFDALTTARPYKKAWTVPDALAHMDQQTGLHFDPDVMAALHERLDEILAVRDRWPETAST